MVVEEFSRSMTLWRRRSSGFHVLSSFIIAAWADGRATLEGLEVCSMAKQKPNGHKLGGKAEALVAGKPVRRAEKPLRGSSTPQSQRKGGR